MHHIDVQINARVRTLNAENMADTELTEASGTTTEAEIQPTQSITTLEELTASFVDKVEESGDIKVNCRILAATNKDLRIEIKEARFREDLYHRLAVIVMEVPALNDRREDVPMLAEHFLSIICEEQGIAKKQFSDDALLELQKVDWTGNIRELRNIIERLVILCDTVISGEDVKMYGNTK